MDWGFDTLFALLGLLLVLEGLLPAISPEKWRCLLEKFLTFSDSGVRTMGVSSMVLGAIIITLTHSWDLLSSVDSSYLASIF